MPTLCHNILIRIQIPPWFDSILFFLLSRIVGGSSGGEAALISAAGPPVGIGSDIGGSIRMPAHFNGIWGHKPSPGMIAAVGQYPYSATPLLSTGPLTR